MIAGGHIIQLWDHDHPLTGNPERDQPARRKAIWGIEHCSVPIGSMYGIYANIWGILMGSMLPYIAYMDPMGYANHWFLGGRDTQWLSKLEVMGQSRRCIKLAFRWLSRMRVPLLTSINQLDRVPTVPAVVVVVVGQLRTVWQKMDQKSPSRSF